MRPVGSRFLFLCQGWDCRYPLRVLIDSSVVGQIEISALTTACSGRLRAVQEADESIGMNRWKIPDWLEQEVIERDRSCIYCGVAFGLSEARFGSRPSWEHIVNDAGIITRENIALCCRSCNSSKGVKQLAVWLDSPYCKKRKINGNTVAEVVKNAL